MSTKFRIKIDKYTTDPGNTDLIFVKPPKRKVVLKKGENYFSNGIGVRKNEIQYSKTKRIEQVLNSVVGVKIPMSTISKIVDIIEE